MSEFYSDRQQGNAVERVVLDLCQIQGISAELNPTPDPDLAPDEQIRREWYEARASYDISIAGYWCDVKWDKASWRYRNFCIELAGLEHTKSQFYIYALPRPSSIHFCVVPVPQLWDLYKSGKWPVKVTGEQLTNRGVHPPVEVLDSVGMNFYQFGKIVKLAA